MSCNKQNTRSLQTFAKKHRVEYYVSINQESHAVSALRIMILTKTPHKKTNNDAFIGGLELAGAKLAATLPTQWLQNTMRRQQITKKGISSTLKEICAGSPRVMGIPTDLFFRGVLTGAAKECYKGLYKGTFLKGAPKIAQTYAPLSSSPMLHHTSTSLLAASIAATADVGLGLIPERIATYQATATAEHRDANFISDLKKRNYFKFLTQRATAMAAKSLLASGTLFSTAPLIQKSIHAHFQLKPGEKIPPRASALTAIATGTAVALVSTGPDIVKTMQQMPSAKTDESLFVTIRNNIKSHGLRGLFAGTVLKINLGIVGWSLAAMFTVQDKVVPKHYLWGEDRFVPEPPKPIKPSAIEALSEPVITSTYPKQ